ncbi:MAG: ABC transporter substrate-binding protein [Deltaproteobacteria bacterium]|nr:ABC transporter substrate-binding protein [Deltaproteobacteria bacterium]
MRKQNMRISMRIFGLLLGLFLLATSSVAEIIAPLAKVQATIESCQSAVRAKKSQLSEEQLKKELEVIIRPVFDFREMAKRCLGSNWADGKPEQQEEFVSLFSELLARTYLNKIIKGIEDSTFSYPENRVEKDRAIVMTQIKNNDEKIAIDYRLFLKDNSWLIYDVIIENVGLVSNYRAEFSAIIRKEGYEGLLERLRKK